MKALENLQIHSTYKAYKYMLKLTSRNYANKSASKITNIQFDYCLPPDKYLEIGKNT